MAIVPYRQRGGTLAVRRTIDKGGNLTARQKTAIARVASAAGKALLRAQFAKQNSGADSHNAVTARKRNNRRGTISHADRSALMNMPDDDHLTRDQFENMDHKAMMMEAWKASPATSNIMAPRGLGYYDAFETFPTSAMTHMSIGPATPIIGKTTVPMIDTGNKSPQLLIVQPAASANQAGLYTISSATPTDTINYQGFNSPQLQSDAPEEIIPTRCSLRIGNYTAAINQGGLVRVLRMTTGVLLDSQYTTNAELLNLMEGIREHRRTRTYRGTEFEEDLQKNCIVADQSRSLAFQNFEEIIPSNLVPWLPQGGAPTDVYPWVRNLYDPTYTPIAILFEPFLNVQPGGAGAPLGNTYQVTVQSQFLAHYKQGSMLANLAISPMSDSNTINAHRDKEERKGSALDKIWHGVQQVAKFGWQNRAIIGPAVGAFL